MLVAVVVVETLVLALLSVVVVALLRSHAEILRRLPEPDDASRKRPLAHDEPIDLADGPRLPAHLPSPRRRATEAHDIVGTTPDGDAVAVSMAVGSNTVVAFLSTGCLTCRTFWDGLQPDGSHAVAGRRAGRRCREGPGVREPVEAARARAAGCPGRAVLACVGGLRDRDVAVLLLRRRSHRRGPQRGRGDDVGAGGVAAPRCAARRGARPRGHEPGVGSGRYRRSSSSASRSPSPRASGRRGRREECRCWEASPRSGSGGAGLGGG